MAEPFIYYDVSEKTIYMRWATDLLPYQIDSNKNKINLKKQGFASFVGTY